MVDVAFMFLLISLTMSITINIQRIKIVKQESKIFQDDKMPLSLKRQVFDQCVLPTVTYGCQTLSLTKVTTQRLRTAQRAMDRKMLKAQWKDKIPCREIRAKTNIKEVVKFAAKQKWKWAGHVARLKGITWGRDAGQ